MAKKKRLHNEGSIYKRSNGTWRAQVTLEGGRLSFSGKSQRECREWIKDILDQADQGMTYDSAQVTLGQFLQDWLVSTESTIRVSTFKQYTQITNQYLIPFLGNIKLIDLKSEHIQNRYNMMVEKGYGLRTIQLTHSVIHRALVQAVKLGLISRNPDDATTPPKPKKKEMRFYDQDQSQKLLITAQANQDKYFPLYYLAIATGMRQAELLGLKWSDLDWEQGSLRVQRQLTRRKAGGFELTAPKTKAGNRKISLGSGTLMVLREHQQAQFKLMQEEIGKWQDQDLIFTTTIGTPTDKYTLLKSFKKLCREAGLPEIRFHDLRHTAASLMLNNGIPVIVVSRRLGHARPSITLDVYGHLIPSKQQEAAEIMDELLTPISVELIP